MAFRFCRWLMMLCIFVLSACRPAGQDTIEVQLMNHPAVQASLAGSGEAAVLLLNPAHVRMCALLLAEWMEKDDPRVHIFLTREPEPHEELQLRLARIQPSVIDIKKSSEILRSPTEYFLSPDSVAKWHLSTRPGQKSVLLTNLVSLDLVQKKAINSARSVHFSTPSTIED